MHIKTKILATIVAIYLTTTTGYTKDIKSMNEIETQVLSTVETMTHAFHAKNIEGVMASYEKQAVVVFEPLSPISDADQIKQMFEGAFTLNPEFTYAGHEVFVSEDIALHIAPWQMEGKMPDGQVIEQSGLSVAVLRKQSDDTWRMVIDNPHGQLLLQR